ncbi:MAG: pilus assembly protein TadG-related protein [Candidatus Limnocylindrales bacterium]
MLTSSRSRREDGQVLVIFAIALLVLLGSTALATDYGFWLQEKRAIQNAADAAAQSAISELSVRPITVSKQTAAARHAMDYLDEQLGLGLRANGQLICAAAAASDPAGNGFGPEDCTSYAGPDRVSIRTPVNVGMGCAGGGWGTRAITVRVQRMSARFFSRIYSNSDQAVGVCATSAIYGGGLAVAVLKPNTGDQPNSANLTMKLAGSNTFVRIWGGDIGINATFSAAGAPPPTSPNDPAFVKFMTAAGTGISDNRMYATIEAPSPMSWDVTARQVRTEGLTNATFDDLYHAPMHLPAYIPIPGWGNGLFAALTDGLTAPTTLRSGTAATGTCTDPVGGAIGIAPGKYDLIEVSVLQRRWLCPGVYHLVSRSGTEGVQIGRDGILAGQGVTIVLESDSGLRVSSGGTLLLNTAAAGGSVTPAPWRTGDVRHDQPLSIWIEPIAACNPLQPACSDSVSTSVFDIAGGSGMDVKGIIYGPTDNMKIAGNGTHHGSGEIWAWTIVYAGGSELDQTYEGSDDGFPLIVE